MGIFNKKEIAEINVRLNKIEKTLARLVKKRKPKPPKTIEEDLADRLKGKAPAVKKIAKKTIKKTTRKKKGKSE